ncbi:zinc knuckle CX2CX4HX4C containing protein [Tanacetum coccineum]
MEPIAQTLDSNNGSQTIQSGYQIGMVKEIVSPNEGCSNSMVNDISSHTNDVHTTDKSSLSAVSIPKDAVDEIKLRFVNTLYGYSVGKRLAFPLVMIFVKHAWAKFGLKHAMSHHGMFLFQFETKAGMEKVMEGGPWRINLVPFILKEWKLNTLLKKEEVYTVPLWVKMHNVPIVAYKKLDWKSIELQRVAVCPKKQAIYPKKSSATEDKGKQIAIKPVVNTGKKNTDKKVSTQRYIKGYRVNNPKTKLVYRAVVKPQTDNHVSNNMEQSSNTTKPPSPPDSSKDGKPNYISDDISFDAVRKFINKSIEEESILEYIGNNTKEGCSSGEIQDDKVSSKKPSSSMEVLNADSDTDVEEVFQPDDGMSFPTSSFGGGQQLEGEILDAYEDYEVQFEEHSSLYQEFCDQFDFKLKCRGRK